MLLAGIVDRSGRFQVDGRPDGSDSPAKMAAAVPPGRGQESGSGRDVVLTQADVENLIRTKGAIYAAADSLVQGVGLSFADIQKVYIAGAFGNRLDVAHCIAIGLLPDVPMERIEFIGNSSVAGAKLVMLSRRMFDEVHRIRDRITYRELMVDPTYMEQFTSACFLPHTDLSRFPSVGQEQCGADVRHDNAANVWTQEIAMTFSIAIAGKGGIGKTTLSALLVRALREAGIRPILAVDADPNSNLAEALGVEPGRPLAEIREQGSSPEGSPPSGIGRVRAVEDEIQRAITEADGFDLITMGRPEGPRCYCAVNNLLRKSLDDLSRNYAAVVVDNEAGMEHLSRRTTNDVDLLVVVMNPTLPVDPGGAADPGAFPRVAGADRPADVAGQPRRPEGTPEAVERELAGLHAERLPDVPQDDEVERGGSRRTGRLPPAGRIVRRWWRSAASCKVLTVAARRCGQLDRSALKSTDRKESLA